MTQANPHALHSELLVALLDGKWSAARRLADDLCLMARDNGGSLPPQCSVDAARWEDAPTVVTDRLELVDSLAGL
jgi:hypothetical protein